MSDVVLRWIEDGHGLTFKLNRGAIEVGVDCPYEGRVGVCNRGRDYCVVQRFVGVYGPEVNLGVAPIDGWLEIAWLPQPGDGDIDREFIQVWVIPTEDQDYLELKAGVADSGNASLEASES